MPAPPFPSRPARLGWHDAPLLLEALAMLAGASAAIRLLPFRRVAAAAGTWGRSTRRAPPDVGRTVRAVEAWARRVPWKAVCFQQGLALHLLLRRRGVRSVLHYGVRQSPGEGLAAHVWVSVGGHPVIGGGEAPRFQCLARFPATGAE